MSCKAVLVFRAKGTVLVLYGTSRVLATRTSSRSNHAAPTQYESQIAISNRGSMRRQTRSMRQNKRIIPELATRVMDWQKLI